MGHREGQGLLNSRMLEKRLIHTAWNHLVSATVDHFLVATGEEQTRLRIKIALMSGKEP
jgi:hypothetical protein